MQLPNNTSHHILGTSANLLGFCLIVLTSIHFANKTANSILDEVTSVVAMLLVLSCLFSFASIKATSDTKAKRFETAADYLFIISLLGIFAIILFVLIKYSIY